ncbi:MAG: hypothetical protein LBJ67_06560 [Planctomycetaceae bacterium]|nr:hypothetical protein [Planctomycetaceae bacterium]
MYMPKYCSWLNRIEILFSSMNRRVLWRGDFDSVTTLEAKIRHYIEFYNQNAKPMKWNFHPKKENANNTVGVKRI